MRAPADSESRAIARLIAEIDSIDALRDRVPKVIMGLFFAVFLLAVGLLTYVATHAHPRVVPPGEHPLSGVLR